MLENILCLQVFSLNVLKFDLYVLKQSIFRALKRDLERAYLMIVGKSSHFTSCFIDVVIYAQPSFVSACEAWIPKNDCRHFMHSSFEAIVRFWTINKRKCVTRWSKGKRSMKLDGSPTNSEMNLDNCMTIGMLPYPRNVGTHLNWREGQWKYREFISFSLILAILYDSPAVAGA